MDIKYFENRKRKNLKKLPKLIADKDSYKKDKVLPNRIVVDKMLNIVLNFIKRKKRKIYGGLAINKAIIKKSPKDKIYNKNDTPDYDFYSPDYFEDIVELCNELYKSGIKYVRAEQSFHPNTCSIKAELYEKNIADISYIPLNIYNHIPTYTINKIKYVKPEFTIIDSYRILMDPITSWFRLEKVYPRVQILEKFHILPSKLPPVTKNFTEKKHPNIYTNIQSDLYNNIVSKHNIVVIGTYAYNELIQFLKIDDYKKRQVNNNLLECLLFSNSIKGTSKNKITNSHKIAKELLWNVNREIQKHLMLIYKIKKSSITYVEYNKFVDFYEISEEIRIDNIPIIRIYVTHKCIPFHMTRNQVNIASFYLLLYLLMGYKFYLQVSEEKNSKKKYEYMIQNLLYLREDWYKKKKMTGLENTLFKELGFNCIGTNIHSPFQIKMMKGKNLKYEPNQKNINKYEKQIEKITNKYELEIMDGNIIKK